jgi:hypothetical protein
MDREKPCGDGRDGDSAGVDRERVDKFWDNPLNVLHLIDLLFIEDETRPKIVS